MKNIIYLVFAVILFSSCNDFLDTENYTKKDTSNFPMNVDDADKAIAGIYSILVNLSTDDVVHDPFFFSELASDERLGGGGTNDASFQCLDRLMCISLDDFGGLWGWSYKGIYRANTAIETFNKIKDWADQKQYDQYLGEVYFMRAWYYTYLVQAFEGVPLVLKTEPVNLPRSSADEVYAQIAADLEKAIELLPSDRYDSVKPGHATKWAAEAFMARLFLFYTGFYGKNSLPTVGGTSINKQQVVLWLEDCINNSGHELVHPFYNLLTYTNKYTAKNYPFVLDNGYSWAGDGNKETIFSIKFSNTGGIYTTKPTLYYGLRGPNGGENTFPFGQGWGAGPVTQTLWNEWQQQEPNDIRRTATILNVKTELNSYTYGADNQVEETGFWQKKYIPIRAYNNGNLDFSYSVQMSGAMNTLYESNNQDIVLIRLADVYLMHSELTETATYLNSVRNRVGLPNVSYSLEAIKRERRWELAFEGVRWNDIRRWGDAANLLAKQQNIAIKNEGKDTYMKSFGGGYEVRYKATRGFWAIPKSQITLSEGMLKQNPGWDEQSIYQGW